MKTYRIVSDLYGIVQEGLTKEKAEEIWENTPLDDPNECLWVEEEG